MIVKVILLVGAILYFPQSTDSSFYKALSSESVEILDAKIDQLKNNPESVSNNAYLGAIIMKRSSYEKVVKNKVDMFRIGHALLEKEITNNKENVEYRFLRLAVQENAPKILKYNQNIESDKAYIILHYSETSPMLQNQIMSYAKTSNVLLPEELL